MNFLIVTHVEHKRNELNQLGAYGPYVKEMNIWGKYVDQITIVGPFWHKPFNPIDLPYNHPNINFVEIPEINVTTAKSFFHAAKSLPIILSTLYRQMKKADHIQLRCPGNIALLGCLVQIFFPKTKKTAKYAGNWDWNSNQPRSYRMQQHLLNNTFLTKNMQALVYGNWPGSTKNILPFFTATYREADKVPTPIRSLSATQKINLIFVGVLGKNKEPILSVKVAEAMLKAGYDVTLNMYGEGYERPRLEAYIEEKNLGQSVILHGNQPAQTIRESFIKSHFLIFISQSEGWPKVVAESMFWGCVPITTRVSCVADMLNEGERGTLVEPNPDVVVQALKQYIDQPEKYAQAATKGMEWSRQFTMEKFETEIAKLV